MNMLAKIIVEDILVFAYSSEEQMKEDFSVAQLERIAQALHSLGAQVISEFLLTVSLMQQEAEEQGLNERAQQLNLLPEHIGLDVQR